VAGAERELSETRRIVVLEGDTVGRSSTESLLRREDYSVVVTQHAGAALRLASASAVDLVLVDLGLGCVEAVPVRHRRRGDPPSPEEFVVPEHLARADPGERGYAVLRPLHLDPAAAGFPVVTLRTAGGFAETPPPGRFAAVAFLPRPEAEGAFVEGLRAVFRDVVRRGSPAAPGPPPFESTAPALRTALLVDPDDRGRRAVADELARHGFIVHEARSAAEALRLAVARRPWLVLAEVDLPDEDGLTLCRRMRDHSLLRRTPVVFLSARDDAATRYEALRAGADDFLVKPAPSREMLIRLDLLLRRFSEIDPGSEPGAGLRGAVELVGAPAVLQICHINQLTGVLVAHRGSQSVRIAFRAGQVVSATGPDHEGPPVVYDFVGWPNGQFAFDRDAVVEGTLMTADFNVLLLEGCRRLDERRRGRLADAPDAFEAEAPHH
jgi:DNA-binding response OmpR family regulator